MTSIPDLSGVACAMRASTLLAALLAVPLSGASLAQDAWPSRAVRVVVPSSPGGGTDVYARLIANALGESLKQQFVVDNRPGASGNIGAEIVARAAPDGYTFLVSASPAVIINPSLFRNLAYDVERDLVPVSAGVVSPMVFCVHPSAPMRSIADLIEAAKKDPGNLSYGSAGVGSSTNLGVRMLEERSGAKFLHVPFKGVAPAISALLSGQIQFVLADVPSAINQLRSGKLIGIAVTNRLGALPNIPTMSEAGFENFDVAATFSVMAPAGTPAAIVHRVNAEIVSAMKTPALAEKLEAQSLIPVFDTPEQFGERLKTLRSMWAAFIKRNAIAQDQ